MASNQFTDILKYGISHASCGLYTQGEVLQAIDSRIRKAIFKIKGDISTTNWLRVPKTVKKGTTGLGFTGRYLYVLARGISGRHATFHIDIVKSDASTCRLTLSTTFQVYRSNGSIYRIPISMSNEWTVFLIDIPSVIRLGGDKVKFISLKAVTLCATMAIRSVISSQILFSGETLPLDLQLPESVNIKWESVPNSTERIVIYNSVLPDKSTEETRVEAGVPVTQEVAKIFHLSNPEKQKFELSRLLVQSPSETRISTSAKIGNETKSVENSNCVNISGVTKVSGPINDECKTLEIVSSRESQLLQDKNEVLLKANKIMRDAGIFLYHPGQDLVEISNSRSRYQNLSISRDILKSLPSQSVYNYPSKLTTSWPDPILKLVRIIGVTPSVQNGLLWTRTQSSSLLYASNSTLVVRQSCLNGNASENMLVAQNNQYTDASACNNKVQPPLVKEEYLDGHSGVISGLAISHDGLIAASVQNLPECELRLWDLEKNSCIAILKEPSHKVNVVCFSHRLTSPHKFVFASIEHDIYSYLCTVGNETNGRTQLSIWTMLDTLVGRKKQLHLVARQTSDVTIYRAYFSYYENPGSIALVSCGQENIRLWRMPSSVKSSDKNLDINKLTSHLHIPGSPMILKEYARGTLFTDIAFDCFLGNLPPNHRQMRPLYVSSDRGNVVVINYDSREIICVYQLHSSEITRIAINEGFCITGAKDGFLRVWPLDFKEFLLEAPHESAIINIAISNNGMCVAVGDENGSIGILDILTSSYNTVLRSHTKAITSLVTSTIKIINPSCSTKGSNIVPFRDVNNDDSYSIHLGLSSSQDATIRVWNLMTAEQAYEFDMSKDEVTCISVAPIQYEQVFGKHQVTVGFRSGVCRVFDYVMRLNQSDSDSTIQNLASNELSHLSNQEGDEQRENTSVMIAEFHHHNTPIHKISYVLGMKKNGQDFETDLLGSQAQVRNAACFLFTSGTGQELCRYSFRCNADKLYQIQQMAKVDGSGEFATRLFENNSNNNLIANNEYLSKRDVAICLAVISTDRLKVHIMDGMTFVMQYSLRPYKQKRGNDIEEEYKNQLQFVRFSSEGDLLFVLSVSDRLYVYSMETQELLVSSLLIGQVSIKSIALSPNGKYLSTGGQDGSIRIWQLSRSKLLTNSQMISSNQDQASSIMLHRPFQSFSAQLGPVIHLEFTDDASYLVATGSNSTITIWSFLGDKEGCVGSTIIQSAVEMSENSETFDKCNPLASLSYNYEVSDLYCDDDRLIPSMETPKPTPKPQKHLTLVPQHQNRANINLNDQVAQSQDNEVGTLILTECETRVATFYPYQVLDGSDINLFLWSYATGTFIFTIDNLHGSLLVLESIDTGKQEFLMDFEENVGTERVSRIGHLVMSQSSLLIAAVSAAVTDNMQTFILIQEWRALTLSFHIADHGRLYVPVPTTDIKSIAFDSHDQHLCIIYRGATPITKTQINEGQSPIALFVSYYSIQSGQWLDKKYHSVDSTTESSISNYTLYFSSAMERMYLIFIRESNSLAWYDYFQLQNLNAQQSYDEHSIIRSNQVDEVLVQEESSAIKAKHVVILPMTAQCIAFSPLNDNYMVVVTKDSKCYFYDITTDKLIAATQLATIQSGQFHKVNCVKWIGGKDQVLVSAALINNLDQQDKDDKQKIESIIYVHKLPMCSTRSSATVDWGLTGRGCLPLLTKINLNNPIRFLLVDPLVSSYGVAVTCSHAVITINFKKTSSNSSSSALFKALKRTNAMSSHNNETVQPRKTSLLSGDPSLKNSSPMCYGPVEKTMMPKYGIIETQWLFKQSVLLTLSSSDVAVRWWSGLTGQEITQTNVEKGYPTCFASNEQYIDLGQRSGINSIIALAIGYSDGYIRLADAKNLKLISKWQIPTGSRKSKPSVQYKSLIPSCSPQRVDCAKFIQFLSPSILVVITSIRHHVYLFDITHHVSRDVGAIAPNQELARHGKTKANRKSGNSDPVSRCHVLFTPVRLRRKDMTKSDLKILSIDSIDVKQTNTNSSTQVQAQPFLIVINTQFSVFDGVHTTAKKCYVFESPQPIQKSRSKVSRPQSEKLSMSIQDDWDTTYTYPCRHDERMCRESLTRFLPGSENLVIFPSSQKYGTNVATGYSFDVRDYHSHTLLQRIQVNSSRHFIRLGWLRMSKYVSKNSNTAEADHMSLQNESHNRGLNSLNDMMMLLIDKQHQLLLIDLQSRELIPVNSSAIAKKLNLVPCLPQYPAAPVQMKNIYLPLGLEEYESIAQVILSHSSSNLLMLGQISISNKRSEA